MSGKQEAVRLPDGERALRQLANTLRLKPFGFYFLVPFALALLIATETGGYNRMFGYTGALFYVSLFSFIPWWTAEACTRLCKAVLAPWRPKLWVLTLLGALLACVLVFLYSPWLVHAFFAVELPGVRVDMDTAHADGDWHKSLVQSARAVFFWMVANHIFDRYLGWPRLRYEPARAPAPALPVVAADTENPEHPSRPEDTAATASNAGPGNALLKRLKRFSALEQIIAVKAEEHYVCAHGAGFKELVLYRFSQALTDLEGEEGFRVHRSYWVRADAIAEYKLDGNRLELVLADGTTIPVSQRYRALVEQVLKPA